MSDDLEVSLSLWNGDDILHIRNRALLLFLFFSAMRRSEVADARISNITFRDNGFVVNIPKSRTDQEGVGVSIGN